MKKIIGFLSVCALTIFAAGFACLKPAQTSAEEVPTVYVSANGNDENSGTERSPYQTLDKALTAAQDGATIVLQGTVAIDRWATHNKTATIKGGTLDVSEMGKSVNIRDHITFQDVIWNVAFVPDTNDAQKNSVSVYANGYEVKMDQNVSWSSEITLFGGGENTTVASTDLTVLSGHYITIYGGTRGGTVTGDTNLYVGGNVNEGIDVLNGPDRYKVFAGGYDNAIQGTANVTFGGDAKARYIYGGQYYKNTLKGGANVTINGGEVMSVYGGSKGSEFKGNTTTVVNGGKITQIFGGSEEGNVTGNVALKLLGGEVTRRVYGGCYNNYKIIGGWQSQYCVSGAVTLEIGGTANISFSSNESDKGIFAFSRYGSKLETGGTQIVFTSESAYNAYKDKLGDEYNGSSWNLDGADNYHYYTYEVEDGVCTQNCAYHDLSATATWSFDAEKCCYTGEAVQPISLEVSENWEYTSPALTYENNVKVGNAKATLSFGSESVEKEFVIVDTPTILGGSVRVGSNSGLRFQSKVDGALKDMDGVRFGTLILPKAVLGDAELTVNTAKVENVPQEKWATLSVQDSNPASYEEGYEYFNAVLHSIPEDYYDESIVARSYVYANGIYYYADAMERSTMQVASYALRDGRTESILFDYVNKGLEGKEISITTEKVMEYRNSEIELSGAQGCVAVWTSSNTDVLTVDKYGQLSALRMGKATVTATLGNHIITKEIVITSGWTGII